LQTVLNERRIVSVILQMQNPKRGFHVRYFSDSWPLERPRPWFAHWLSC
jgi:hypothetical protein